MEDYIKCELIDGGSHRHLKIFLILFLFLNLVVAVHYTRDNHYTLCIHSCYC